MITAEKPQLSLIFTVAAGVTNIVLDALFVAAFNWGLQGAAIATIVSQFVGCILPLVFFFKRNTSLLRLGKTKMDFGALIKTCTNGSSELMTNISMSLVGILYNTQLLKYAGEPGVAAYGVLMYVNFIFISAFIGYSIGCAPVIGYHYGADNSAELKGLLKKSTVIIAHIVKATGKGNVGYFFIGSCKLCATLQNAVAYKVAEGSHTGQMLEGTAKLGLA